MKSQHLTEFTKDLNQYSIMLSDVNYTESEGIKSFSFMLNAQSDKNITELLKYLTNTKTDKYQFSLEKIFFDQNQTQYVSELKVQIL